MVNYCNTLQKRSIVTTCNLPPPQKDQLLDLLIIGGGRECAKLYWGTHREGEPYVIKVAHHNVKVSNPDIGEAWRNQVRSLEVFANCKLTIFMLKNFKQPSQEQRKQMSHWYYIEFDGSIYEADLAKTEWPFGAHRKDAKEKGWSLGDISSYKCKGKF